MSTKQKTRNKKSQQKTPATAEFVDADQRPEAETISELKASNPSKKKPQSSAQKKGEGSQEQKSAPRPTHQDKSLPVGDRLYLRFGRRGCVNIVLLLRAAMFFVFLLVSMAASFTMAIYAVPESMVIITDATGVGPGDAFPIMMMGVLLPGLFMVGMLVALTFSMIVVLWKASVRIGDKARDAMLGE